MCQSRSYEQKLCAFVFFALCTVLVPVTGGKTPPLQSFGNAITRSATAITSTLKKRHSDLQTRNKSWIETKRKQTGNHCSLYGMPMDIVYGPNNARAKKRSSSSTRVPSDVMDYVLNELRELRTAQMDKARDIDVLKKENRDLRKKLSELMATLAGTELEDESQQEGGGQTSVMEKIMKQKEFDKIGMEVERWAEQIMFNEAPESNGFQEIPCLGFMKNQINKNGQTKCYLKWMTDSRGKNADKNYSGKLHPCLKCFTTIDAPMEDVCAYLADPKRVGEYNDFVIKHRDLEEITPHSKICWGLCPQILFVKSRDFVTFCHHRWLRDGTQVVVNQACEHPSAPGVDTETEGKVCRAHAIRGANFISRDPHNPNKTRFSILIHADPGGNIPHWACKKVVGCLAPIEPFKLCHRVNEGVKRARPSRRAIPVQAGGRSGAPAGLAQLGYACFWPKGGGLKEGNLGRFVPRKFPANNNNNDNDNEPNKPLLDDDDNHDGAEENAVRNVVYKDK